MGIIWLLFAIVVSGLLVRGTYRASRKPGADDAMTVVVGAFLIIVVWVACLWGCWMTTGVYRGYSVGARDGYLTKLSTKGLVFKTNEAQIQVGTGAQAALQEPFEFSIPDPDLNSQAQSLSGKHVRIHYTQWLMQPAWRGGSGYEATSIQEVE
jgi:hypothetical protein